MNSWVRYSVAVYVGLLLAGSVVVPPTLTAGSSAARMAEAPMPWTPIDDGRSGAELYRPPPAPSEQEPAASAMKVTGPPTANRPAGALP